MSELEDLPSWAGQGADDSRPIQQQGPVQYQAPPPPSRKGRIIGLALVGLLALVATGALGFFLARSQSGSGTAAELDEQAATPTTAVEQAAADDASEAAAADGSDADADEQAVETEATDDAMADDEAMADESDDEAAGATGTEGEDEDGEQAADETTADDAEADEADDAADGSALEVTSDRQAVFRGGKVYLMGKVPSEEIAEVIVGKAAAVVGPDNVVNEYEIDPTTEIRPGESAPLYVEDVVLFEFNSISIEQPFLPLLDLGVLLLRQNPQASMTIVTRTDAVGSEEINLQVARQRAQAVVNYMAGRGISTDQIKADPRGEEGASEDDDEQTAALNRRAEFIITGLLD